MSTRQLEVLIQCLKKLGLEPMYEPIGKIESPTMIFVRDPRTDKRNSLLVPGYSNSGEHIMMVPRNDELEILVLESLKKNNLPCLFFVKTINMDPF
jgi:hypothetical protein